MGSVDSKESENTKARQLYKYPKLATQNLLVDSYGFLTKSKVVYEQKSILKLRKKWEKLIAENKKNGDGQVQKNNFYRIESSKSSLDESVVDLEKETSMCSLKGMIFKGVPLFFKKKVWSYILQHKKNYLTIKNKEYIRLKSMTSGFEYQIHVDIQRTFRKHILFYDEFGAGQCSLFRILVAYANYNTHIGYCQGMASFTGLILMYFDELETFNILVNILSWLNTLFDSKLSLLPMLMSVQKEVFILVVPEIYYILKNEHVDLCLFVYSWYLTLFSRFDIKLTLRIWDIFIFYGPASLLAVSSAILSFYVRRLTEIRGEHLISFLSSMDGMELTDEEVESIISKVKNILDEIDLEDINNILDFK